MTAVEDIRLQNLARLIASHGGQRQLADAIGKSPAQISQWMNKAPDAKTGKPRALGSRAARSIEEVLGLGEGWLDTVHGQPGDGELTLSQSGRPDFERIAGAVRIVHDFLAYEGEPSAGVYDPEMLSIAWEVVERSGQKITPDNVIQFVRRFRQVVAEGDAGGEERLLGRHRG